MPKHPWIAGTLCAAGTFAPLTLPAAGADPTAPMTATLAQSLSQNPQHQVIVLMKNQLTGAAASNDQAPLLNELNQVHAPRVKSFHMVNALAATVSDGELDRLKANPAVAAVVPDIVILRKPRSASATAKGKQAASAPPTSLPLNTIPGACGSNGQVQLDPEGLATTHSASANPQEQTARALGYTGAGVTVGYIADGIDTRNVNFLRANGNSVFVDYQDFSGDGPGEPTDGGEAFIDANAIAGQGLHVYNVSGYAAQPDPAVCNVRIEGVAPGVALVGFDVFGSYEDTVESNFLQALEYAVTVDHVSVLNESFGNNPYPDAGALDVQKQFNDAAVAAGVTITVAAGDAGPTDTIGSPATDPKVIAVGGSTTFRFYAQTNYGAARYFATSGWLNDNISGLSSGGFEQSGATLDLVAPGDLAWASCDASPNFADCTNFATGAPSNIESSGGTSLSSPLTAGAAALVIEAYRRYHSGSSPSPALVKQILTSTATDLALPAVEQGSGLLNTYKAVLLAESINNGRPPAAPAGGQGLVFTHDQLNAIGLPGAAQNWSVTVTNPSAEAQSVRASSRTFGPDQNVQTGSVNLSDAASPEFEDSFGYQNDYATFTFSVPANAARLTAEIASPDTAEMSLIDPQGRFAGYSIPQGLGNFNSVDVRDPAPGTWTGVIFDLSAAAGGKPGPSTWRIATQNIVPFATVSPAAFVLAPGQSRSVEVTASTPSNPGDASGSIVLSASGGGTDSILGQQNNSIPVTLRSLINVARGGDFSGQLTGGNGRAPGNGQVAYYQFNIGPGHTSITANVTLSGDAADSVGSYLIAPDGTALGFGQNTVLSVHGKNLTAYVLNPAAGTWTLIIDLAEPVVGDRISERYTGNVVLDQTSASAAGLPNSTHHRLPAGIPVTVPVTITNTGAAPGAFFIDARLNTNTVLSLGSFSPPATSSGYALPLGSTSDTATPEWLVPPQSSRVLVTAAATVPIMFDYGANQGDPDLLGASTGGNQAEGSYAPTGGALQPGLWYADPSELGPYSGPAASGFANLAMDVYTAEFDSTVTSSSGDLWLASIDPTSLATFTPIVINPGQSAIVDVTLTPFGPSGSSVSGNLYIDMLTDAVAPYGELTGDQLATIPYSYTIQ